MPHDFLPVDYVQAQHDVRLAWARDHLVTTGVWSGFTDNTSVALAKLFRQPARLDAALPPVISELAAQGHPHGSMLALAKCLPAREVYLLAGRLATKGNGLSPLVESLIPLLDDHYQGLLCLVGVRYRLDALFDRLISRVPLASYKQYMSVALEVGNTHAGLALLGSTTVTPLDYVRDRRGDVSRFDKLWSQGLAAGTVPIPASTRTLKFWRKRLPGVDAYLRAHELHQVAQQSRDLSSSAPLSRSGTPKL
jgi:hypothetical protein